MCTGIEIALITATVAATTTSVIAATKKPPSFEPASISAQLPQAEPVVPEPAKIMEDAREEARKRLRARTKTILTSPVGLVAEPDISRKTLLGE